MDLYADLTEKHPLGSLIHMRLSFLGERGNGILLMAATDSGANNSDNFSLSKYGLSLDQVKQIHPSVLVLNPSIQGSNQTFTDCPSPILKQTPLTILSFCILNSFPYL